MNQQLRTNEDIEGHFSGGDTDTSRVSTPKKLGEILVEQGHISNSEVEAILSYAAEHGKRFGEAAVKMKLISAAELKFAIAKQFDCAPLMRGESGISLELVAAYAPQSNGTRALRELRRKLMLRWYNDSSRTLAIIGDREGEGCSYLAANLSVVFSQFGHKTLLIDCNFERPRQHILFDIDNGLGLSAAITNRESFPSVIQQINAIDNLSVIPAGAMPPDSIELLNRSTFAQGLKELIGRYDVVFLDAPPVGAASGAESVAMAAGNVLPVYRKNKTVLRRAESFLQLMRDAGVTLVGSVLADH